MTGEKSPRWVMPTLIAAGAVILTIGGVLIWILVAGAATSDSGGTVPITPSAPSPVGLSPEGDTFSYAFIGTKISTVFI